LLRAWVDAAPLRGWSGNGRARVEATDGEVEGELQFVLDPPRRARVEVRSGALFGMVGERVVLSLPGDEHVLIYRERSDALERVPYEASALAELTLSGQPRDLFELIRGRLPWPGGSPPAGWESRARLVESADAGRTLAFRVPLGQAQQAFVLRLRDGILERFELWEGRTQRLQIEYDRWRTAAEDMQPMRIRLKAAQVDVEAEFVIDSLEPREAFTERDFEVY